MKITESKIQQGIIQYLSMVALQKGLIYFAPMNEGVMMVLTMFKIPELTCIKIIAWMRKMGFLPGVLDIQIIYKNTPYFLEVKTETGELNKNQKLFIENLDKQGIKHAVVRSVSDVIGVLGEWGIL